MKKFLRIFGATLLCILFLFFALWKNQVLPDVSTLTDMLRLWAGNIVDLGNVQQAGGGGGNRPTAPSDSDVIPDITLSGGVDSDLETAVCNGISQYHTEIDLTPYNLHKDDANDVLNMIRLSHPEFFYLGTINYLFNTATDMVTKLQISYLYEVADINTKRVEYEAALSQIVSGVPSDGSDFDKLLYLHDYFVREFCYDYTYTIRDAYTLFTQKTGVCQAYMLGLIAAANAVGIRSIPVTSNSMNHAWNLVELDGAWYHVDITWDDLDSLPTHTSYTYFLQSDVGLATTDSDLADPHRDWQCSQTATDDKYDEVIWRDSSTEMLRYDGSYYCTVPEAGGISGAYNALYGGEDPTQMTRICDISGVWRTANPAYRHTRCYAGLGAYNGKLIYNTQNALYIYDLETGATSVKLLSITATTSVYGIASVSATGVVTYIIDTKDISGEPTYGYFDLVAADAA